jgi:hypothetical protein
VKEILIIQNSPDRDHNGGAKMAFRIINRGYIPERGKKIMGRTKIKKMLRRTINPLKEI